MIAGDTANAGIWVRHFIALAMMLLLVTRVFDMSVLWYLAEFVYTGFIFGMMRSFTEHRWGERPSERTAVVESNWVFGFLFLWNNLHARHTTSSPRYHGGNYLVYGASIVNASRRTTAASCFGVTARSQGDGSSRRTSFRFIHPALPARIWCLMRLCSNRISQHSRALRWVRMGHDVALSSRNECEQLRRANRATYVLGC